jgi:hypothetical protein
MYDKDVGCSLKGSTASKKFCSSYIVYVNLLSFQNADTISSENDIFAAAVALLPVPLPLLLCLAADHHTSSSTCCCLCSRYGSSGGRTV